MRSSYTKATLGSVVAAGDPFTVWCNNYACSYRLQHGSQYRAVLSVADLAAYAEKYGEAVTFIDFRARLRCRHCGSGDVSTIGERPYETPKERWAREAKDTPG
jgi:hypothetical protein